MQPDRLTLAAMGIVQRWVHPRQRQLRSLRQAVLQLPYELGDLVLLML